MTGLPPPSLPRKVLQPLPKTAQVALQVFTSCTPTTKDRAGHIANASFAVDKYMRGQGIG